MLLCCLHQSGRRGPLGESSLSTVGTEVKLDRDGGGNGRNAAISPPFAANFHGIDSLQAPHKRAILRPDR